VLPAFNDFEVAETPETIERGTELPIGEFLILISRVSAVRVRIEIYRYLEFFISLLR